MNNKNREQLLAILAITAVALMVGDKFVVQPLIKSWKARGARIVELQKFVVNGAKLLDREETVTEKWDSMRSNTLTNEVSMAESQALRAFERWSRDSGVSVSGIKPQWKRHGDDYVTLECRADASGTLASLARFLYQIEKDPLAMKVDSMDMTTRDQDGRVLTLALQVNGLILSPKTSQTGAPASAAPSVQPSPKAPTNEKE